MSSNKIYETQYNIEKKIKPNSTIQNPNIGNYNNIIMRKENVQHNSKIYPNERTKIIFNSHIIKRKHLKISVSPRTNSLNAEDRPEMQLKSMKLVSQIYGNTDEKNQSIDNLLKTTVNTEKKKRKSDSFTGTGIIFESPIKLQRRRDNSLKDLIKKEIKSPVIKLQNNSKGLLDDPIVISRFNMNTDELDSSFKFQRRNENVFTQLEEMELIENLKMEKFRKIKKTNLVYDSFSFEEEEMETKKSNPIHLDSRFIILPNFSWKKPWDILILFFVIYSILYVPYQIAYITIDTNISLFIDSFIDFIFLIDVGFCFFTAYYDEEENLVTTKMLIVKQYLKTWFLFDFLSSLPYGLILILVEGKTGQLNSLTTISKFYRFIKWMKIMRIFKLSKSRKSKNFIMKKISKISSAVIRLIKFIVFLIVFCYVSGCLFVYLGRMNNSGVPNQSWIIANSLQDSSNSDIFVASIYFIFTTVFTVGYGDIVPKSNSEIFFIILLLSVGCAVYSFALSSISNVFIQNDSKTMIFNQKGIILDEIDKEFKLPEALYNKLKKTIKYDFNKWDEDKMALLETLPSTIKAKLYAKMFEKQIKILSFFEGKTHDFITYVIPLLKSGKFYKNDLLIGLGEIVEEMYLVMKGCLNIEIKKKKQEIALAEIREGYHFGDILMYSNAQSNYNLIVRSKQAEILILKKQDFGQIKLNFSLSVNEILKKSLKIFNLLENRREKIINDFLILEENENKKINYHNNTKKWINEADEEYCSKAMIERKMDLVKQSIYEEDEMDKQIDQIKRSQHSIKSTEEIIQEKSKKKKKFVTISKKIKIINEDKNWEEKSSKPIPILNFKSDNENPSLSEEEEVIQITEQPQATDEGLLNQPYFYINNLNINYNQLNNQKSSPLKNISEEPKIRNQKRNHTLSNNFFSKDDKKKQAKSKSISTNFNTLHVETENETKQKNKTKNFRNSSKIYYEENSPETEKFRRSNRKNLNLTRKLDLFSSKKNLNQIKQQANLYQGGDDLILDHLNEEIENDGFLNKNHEVVVEYLKDYLNNESVAQKIDKKLNNIEKSLKTFSKKIKNKTFSQINKK